MTRIALLAFLAALSASAQPAFSGLATNRDGSKLWFSTRLRLRGTDHNPHSKVYTWDAATGFRLFEQREAALTFPPSGVMSSSFHELISTSVSADGSVIALTAMDECINFTLCVLSNTRYRSSISIAGTPARSDPGSPSVSANGRFALLRESGVFPSGRIADLVSGTLTAPFAIRSGSNVANNGTAIISTGLRLPSGEVRRLPFDDCSRLDSAATKAYCPAAPELTVYDIAAGRASAVIPARGVLSWFSISESGNEILFRDQDGLWFVHADGNDLRQVDQGDVAEAVLSGDGKVVFAVIRGPGYTASLVRIDLGTSSRTLLVPSVTAVRMPIPGVGLELVKGTLYRYSGETGPRIAEIRMPGAGVRALNDSLSELTFQIPFNAPTAAGYPELVLAEPEDGPFVSSIFPNPATIVNYGPFWYALNSSPAAAIAALHEDFHGSVNPLDPALSGEIVHVYGGGFGAVDSAPLAGEPARANPLSRVIEPIECNIQTGNNPDQLPAAEVLYAGLAPGLIGVYQVDIRLPEIPRPGNPDRFPLLRCGIRGNRVAAGFLPIRISL
ncbi:MAG: hypothetical protein U0Q16_28450 [Bryobacteraceae bacterium]